MKKIFLIIFLFIWISNSELLAKELIHNIDKTEQVCVAKTSNTYDMNVCCEQALKSWNKELNKTLNTLKKRLDNDSYNQLIESQILWEKYKKNETKTINKIIQNKEGTMYLNVNCGLRLDIVKNRTLKLQEYLDIINE